MPLDGLCGALSLHADRRQRVPSGAQALSADHRARLLGRSGAPGVQRLSNELGAVVAPQGLRCSPPPQQPLYSGFQLNLLQYYYMRGGVIVQAFFTALPS
jgi:hypothetical protein